MEEQKMEQIFVGSKYEKFEKKVFSIPTFFFGGIYFAYRKMLIHAIIVSLAISILDTLTIKFLNFGLIIITMLCIHISIGLYFPLWYRRFYKNKVKKILSDSSISEENKIKSLQKSGGTSIGFIIIFMIINTILTGSIDKITNYENKNIVTKGSSYTNGNNKDSESSSKRDLTEKNSTDDDSNYKIIEDAHIAGHSSFNGIYQINIGGIEEDSLYDCDADNPEVLTIAGKYDEISIKIYYTEDGDNRIIKKYELYNKETNEKMENVNSEEDIIEQLGYFNEGNHEEELTLIKIDDMPGVGFDDSGTYSYYDYTFKTEEGKELEIKYKIFDSTEDKSDILKENQKYKVKFNVKKGMFDYEYTIIDIGEI